MEISFASPRLKRLCESTKELQRANGQICARKIMARLADMRAAPSLDEFRQLPGRCHVLDGVRRGKLALDVGSGKQLLFEPSHNPSPLNDSGGLDWRHVDAVRVTAITDYHRG